MILNIFKIVIVVILSRPLVGRAMIVNFPKDLDKVRVINLYDMENKFQFHPLSSWRLLEIEKKYEECLRKAPSLYQKNQLLKGWVMTVWGQCALKQSELKVESNLILPFLNTLEKDIETIDKLPWKNSLISLSQKLFQILSQKDNVKTKKIQITIRNIISSRYSLWSSDIKKLVSNFSESSENNFTLGVKSKPIEVGNFENAFKLEKKEKVPSLDYFLPNTSIKDKGLSSFRIENEGILSLLNQSYRKMDFQIITQVADHIEKYFNYSENQITFNLLVGRSYQFLGRYEKSQQYFDKIIFNFNDTDDVQEAFFRSGVNQLRLKKYKEARSYFETLVSLKKEKYDVTGRYWWIRSLEQTNDERAKKEKNSFVNEFPYSYYGLRMAQEQNESQLKLVDENVTLPTTQWEVIGENEIIWKRFTELSKLGWVMEAQIEAQYITLPQNILKQYYIAAFFAKTYQHPLSVKIMNQILDNSNIIKNKNILKKIYPLSYFQLIEKEGIKNKIDPILVLSLIRQESAFGLRALSSSQAAGLMQMIQPTALEVADKLKLKIQFPEDLYQPKINIPMGVYYLAEVLKGTLSNIPIALASYNAGPTRIRQFLSLRSETQDLIKKTNYEWQDELWVDELPWSETTGYVKSILRNSLIYLLLEKESIHLKQDFWRDFIL